MICSEELSQAVFFISSYDCFYNIPWEGQLSETYLICIDIKAISLLS